MGLAATARKLKWVLAAYAALGLALWPVPLVQVLHAESSALVAGVAFFAAGASSVRLFREGGHVRHVLAMQEAALVVPWALLTVTLLWAPNCDYLRGLLFYALFPVVSVALAVAAAYALSGTRLRRPRRWLVGGGLLVVILGPLYDLGLHPQFYTYNHVFGGVLGPIYDEELALRTGLFAFRGLTLLWTLFFFLTGRWLRARGRRGDAEDRGSRIENSEAGQEKEPILHLPSSILKKPTARACRLGMLSAGALIILCYAFSARLGINTPAWYLQEELGGHVRTEHFDIYYDAEALLEAELAVLAEDHEYRYAWLAERLDGAPAGRIASYVYPSPEAKARLTGARYTSVAPVWLPRAQTHVLADRYAASFGHELVHAFSRAFGLPVINASLSVGLVEGLAVALEPPRGRPSPSEQVLAAALAGRSPGVLPAENLALAEDVAARLSPLGFWTGRGAVSYATMGSFVGFLIERYGAERFKRVYAWGNFEEVYGRPVHVLAAEWQHVLAGLPVTASAAGPLAVRRFAVPSLFERRCPHYVPPHVRAYRAGREARAEGDTARARRHLDEALARRPAFAPARLEQARLALATGAPQAALRWLPEDYSTAGAAVVRGDAWAVQGRPDSARAAYGRALRRLPAFAHEAQAHVLLRRLLAGRPSAIRVLVSVGQAAEQAEALAALPRPAPALALQRAVLLLRAGRYAEACALLDATEAPPEASAYAAAVLRRVAQGWQARCAYRTGRPAEARARAKRTAAAYAAAGALNEAAAWRDFARKMTWIAGRGDPSGPAGG